MNEPPSSMFFGPGWRQLSFAFLLGLADAAIFALVYGGTNWFTSQHSWRVAIHTRLDLAIPYVPAATVVYLSLNVMFWTLAFVLRTRVEIAAFVATLAVTTLIAGVFFLLIPATHGYPPPSPGELGTWRPWYELMRTVALEHNYLPSLHVAFTTICVRILLRHGNALERALVLAWGVAIVASTLLTHQHYLIDVLTGFALGWLAVSLGYDRWLARWRSHAAQTTPPTPPNSRARLA